MSHNLFIHTECFLIFDLASQQRFSISKITFNVFLQFKYDDSLINQVKLQRSVKMLKKDQHICFKISQAHAIDLTQD